MKSTLSLDALEVETFAVAADAAWTETDEAASIINCSYIDACLTRPCTL